MLKFITNWIDVIISKIRNNKSNTEYTALTPDDNITNGIEYLNALKWAIDGKKAKNIALSGPYGSGKSSVIDTFLRKYPSIRQRSLKISMATFVEQMTDDNSSSTEHRIAFESDEIEKGILKQLFYKVNHSKIPQSRYRKLHRICFWQILLCMTLLFLAIVLFCFVFCPEVLSLIVNKIIVAGAAIKLSESISIIFATIFISICLIVLSFAYKSILLKIGIREIKLLNNVSFQRNTENPDTVFNRNMDEILYFFEETKYSIVFFEDIDRLNKSSIFVHLRELNTILNNYDAIKKPVVFVYAVRDDIFTESDRTKFFDFIIPIIPIINSTNSGEILLQKLDKSKELNRVHNISEKFVMDVSPFISDMRVLQNIYNEFIIYKATLTTGQNLSLLDEPMLALIIFKNLYPRDFADLQMEDGIVKQAFNDKKEFISQKCNELQERINKSVEILDTIKSEFLTKRKHLKLAFLFEITNGEGIAYNFTLSGYGEIRSSTFIGDNYKIPDWSNNKQCTGYYTNWNGNSGYRFDCSDFNKTYNNLLKNYKAVSLIEDEKIEEEKSLVETTKKQIYDLSTKSLSELLETYGIDPVLSTSVKANSFLAFLLRRGYINERYVDYINYFKATTITTDDMNFILGIKNLSPKPYNYKLCRTDLVIERLQPYEFEREAIYNFNLLEYLLSADKYNEKLDLYIKQLSNGSENSWKFIDMFINLTQYQQRFISLLAKSCNKLWDSIFNNSVLTIERKYLYLSMLISHASLESLEAMDINGNMTAFFVGNREVLQKLSSVEDEKLIQVISKLKIKFVDLNIENVSESILDFIFDNNHYQINVTMIQRIVEYKNKELVPYLETKNFSTLLKLDYSPLLKHIEENITNYIDEIFLLPSNVEEEIASIIKLIELNATCNNRQIQIIENEDFYVEDISTFYIDTWKEQIDYLSSIWNTLMINEKLKPTWKNLYLYWHHLGHTDISINYMAKSADTLEKDDSSCIKDYSFIKEFIKSNIDNDAFSKLLSKLPLDNFDIPIQSLDESKVSIMISQGYFKFDLKHYNEIAEYFPHLCVEYIMHNQNEYMSISDKINMNSSLLESLVFDMRFDRSKAQYLIDYYGAEHMTNRMASNLNSLNLNVNIDIFEPAWKLSDTQQKIRLMIGNLDLIDADKFQSYFSEIGGQYTELSDRSRRHDVALSDDIDNLRLAQRLKSLDYITSFAKKQIKEFEPVNTEEASSSKIICRIKPSK